MFIECVLAELFYLISVFSSILMYIYAPFLLAFCIYMQFIAASASVPVQKAIAATMGSQILGYMCSFQTSQKFKALVCTIYSHSTAILLHAYYIIDIASNVHSYGIPFDSLATYNYILAALSKYVYDYYERLAVV